MVRYGQIIGHAYRNIEAGAWVREDSIDLPAAPDLTGLPIATAVPPSLPALTGVSFDGYLNQDGSVGTRNILGITTTVQCVAPTVDFAVRRIKSELLPHYTNVDDVVAITHGYGCGVAINAPGSRIPIETLRHISLHANIAAQPMVVSLGCEKLQPERLFRSELPILHDLDVIRLQDQQGFAETVNAILLAAEKKLAILNARRRQRRPASDLTVGLQCGGSDAFSGVTCNPAVGAASDLLVRAGATVLFSEVTEVRDAIHLLTPRAVNEDVGNALIREMQWYDDYLAAGHADRSANPTPGNKRGGLSNVVEKALGSIAKAGNSAIAAVASQGEKALRKGLVFAATPASDFICGTQQLASMNLHVFTTGEGSPYGLSLVPVIKVSSRTELAEKWHDLIDVDAGRIATGSASTAQIGQEIFEFILDVASGRKRTWAEHWGLGNALVPSIQDQSPRQVRKDNMNRRNFAKAAASSVAGASLGGTAPAEPQSKGGRMKLGTQHGSTDEILRTIAALGITHICSSLPSPKFDENWSVQGLSKLRQRVESFGIQLESVPLPLSSSYISKSENPAIMLGKSPERDREIDQICRMVENCGRVGISTVKYNMTILGVVRNERTPGRGGASYSTFNYDEAAKDTSLTEAGLVSSEMMWERISYFLQTVIPVAEQSKVRMACHPHDPGMPDKEGFRGVHRVLGSIDGLKRFLNMNASPYHGLNFCQGTVSEMLTDPASQIFDVIRYFGTRKKIFNVHFRNIHGRFLNFQETFPDCGDVDMVKAIRVYKEVGYDGMLMPDHVPIIEGDTVGRQAFAFAFGYIRGLMQAVDA